MLIRNSWAATVAQDTFLAALVNDTSLPSWDPEPIGEYYACVECRFASVLDNLAESAFFTTKLSCTVARFYLTVSMGAGVLGIVMLWALAKGWALSSGLPDPTQVPSALIAFAVGNEFFNAWLAYGNLRTVASTTCKGAKPCEANRGEILCSSRCCCVRTTAH